MKACCRRSTAACERLPSQLVRLEAVRREATPSRSWPREICYTSATARSGPIADCPVVAADVETAAVLQRPVTNASFAIEEETNGPDLFLGERTDIAPSLYPALSSLGRLV